MMLNAVKIMGVPHSSYFVTKTRVKGFIHDNGLELSNNAFNALNNKIQVILHESVERAKKNSRKRLLARDI